MKRISWLNKIRGVRLLAVLMGVAFIMTATVTGVGAAPNLKGQKIYVYTYGGAFLEALNKVWFNPFEKATGAMIIRDGSAAAKLPAAMEAGEFIGDIYIGGDRGGLLNYVSKGWAVRDDRLRQLAAKHGMPKHLQSPDILCHWMYSYIIAASDPSAPIPQSWAEFWDVKGFPGPRGLIRAGPVWQVEAALMADGVPPSELYPLDIERAFSKLNELRKSTKILTAATGAEQINYLATKETAYSIVYSNRVIQALNEGMNLGYTYSQGLYTANGSMILKNARNVDGAVALLEFFMRPDRLASFAEITGLAPSTPEGANSVAKEKRKWMPSYPANLAKQVPGNDEYWQEHRQEIFDRWVKWLAR